MELLDTFHLNVCTKHLTKNLTKFVIAVYYLIKTVEMHLFLNNVVGIVLCAYMLAQLHLICNPEKQVDISVSNMLSGENVYITEYKTVSMLLKMHSHSTKVVHFSRYNTTECCEIMLDTFWVDQDMLY